MLPDQSCLSGTESDGEFDELAVTPEAEDDDEYSIAPDEDAADEEEIDNLMKESHMSLQELLAGYGVSPSNAMEYSTVNKLTGSPVECSVSPSHLGRRQRTIRRSTVPELKADELDSEPSPSKIAKRSPASHRLESLTLNVSSPAMCHEDLFEVNNSKDMHTQLNEPSRLLVSNVARTSHSINPSRRVRSRSLNLNDSHRHRSSTSDTNSELDQPSLQPRSASFEQRMLLQVGDSETPTTTTISTTTDGGGNSSRTDESTSRSLSGPHDEFEEEDPDDETGDEDRDQLRLYSARFWQRAASDGESTPSYNSDEDEDYAPSEERDLEWKGEIRVGDEYQARVPLTISVSPLNGTLEFQSDQPNREGGRLWQPDKLTEDKVIHYERLFAQAVMYSLPSGRTVDDEQALFLLMQCEYDPDEALERLQNKPVHPLELPGYLETWTDADSLAFEKGFAVFGKDFRMIRESRLRHKTIGELVHYYYVWKKTARHDEFARVYRRDKKRTLHPGITDFMDCFALEQEVLTESYLGNMNYTVSLATYDDFSWPQRPVCRNNNTGSFNPPYQGATHRREHLGRRVYSQYSRAQTGKTSGASQVTLSARPQLDRSSTVCTDVKETLQTSSNNDSAKVSSDIDVTVTGGKTSEPSTTGPTVSVYP